MICPLPVPVVVVAPTPFGDETGVPSVTTALGLALRLPEDDPILVNVGTGV